MIDQFRGEYRWLSNFWTQPDWETTNFPITAFGVRIPSVEHGYQAAKAALPHERDMILNASSPGEAKRLGNRIQHREGWGAIKIRVMVELLRRKFSDPDLSSRLLATGDVELVEGNTWGDTFWGAIPGPVISDIKGIPDLWGNKWVGENRLGMELMFLRDRIRRQKEVIGGL